MPESTSFLPKGAELEDRLGLVFGKGIEENLTSSLLDPIEEFLSRPSKRFRQTLVEFGSRLSGQGVIPARVTLGGEVVEAIHAGSLVIDDIQDGSEFRRGLPTLHRTVGIPTALNAGNWLYFWPLEQLKEAGLAPEEELRAYRACHRALFRAHGGQALDVGVSIDAVEQSRVRAVCLASLELKTGALTSLALELGAVLHAASETRLSALARFGSDFGIALQMFDDLGNLALKEVDGKSDPKQFEDLRLRRPSWIWAVVSALPAELWQEWRTAVERLPDASALEAFMQLNGIKQAAHTEAVGFLNSSLALLHEAVRGDARAGEAAKELEALGVKLSRAY